MLKGNVDWAEHDPLLREKADAGLSANQIAGLIPNATRSAVIGRARRIGATLRRIDYKPVPGAPRKPVAAKPAAVKPKPVIVARPPSAPAPKPEPSSAPKASPFDLPEGASAIPLDQLKNIGTCRWPFDRGTPDGETLYCGRPAEGSFCTKHYRMAYVASKPKEAKRW